MTVDELVRAAHEMAREKGFHDGVNPKDPTQLLSWCALIHSEVSEMVECVRDGGLKAHYREDGKPEGFAAELADVVIRACDVAGALGIDLEAAIQEKMEFNASRPFKHGKVL